MQDNCQDTVQYILHEILHLDYEYGIAIRLLYRIREIG
jgi:hypothetical protein